LGSLKEGEDPADKLEGIASKISNFGIRHLQEGMKVESKSGRPVMASFLVQRQEKEKLSHDEILLKPADTLAAAPVKEDPKNLWYKTEEILALLSYDHSNRAELDVKLEQIRSLLESHQQKPPDKNERDQYTSVPSNFIKDAIYREIGDALILHLRIAVEQQRRERKIKETDTTIAQWLNTSRKTVLKYKAELRQKGLLNIDTSAKIQKLSVRFFSKDQDVIEIKG
jgi:hypothetical protein